MYEDTNSSEGNTYLAQYMEGKTLVAKEQGKISCSSLSISPNQKLIPIEFSSGRVSTRGKGGDGYIKYYYLFKQFFGTT